MKLYLSIPLVFILYLAVPGQTKQINLQPCEVAGTDEGAKVKVLCGTFEVFENRAAKSGRRITLKVVVFPATGTDKHSDPVFYIAGGPGSAATEDAPYVAQDMAKVREYRDLVFLDQRGTGGSNPLNCDFFNPADAQSYLGHWNPPDEVRKCRERLETGSDLRLYVTSIAVDDLDDVRAALGYDKINLLAGSYGTRASQEYIKRHGEHVRTASLQGISPTNQFMPRDFAQHTQTALDGVINECLVDKACHDAFQNLRAEAKAVLDTLIKGPVEADVKFPENSDKTTHVKLPRDLAAEAIRYMLYNSASASRIPLFLHMAAGGNFTPLAQAALFYRKELVGSGAGGLYLSVTCAEDLPWIKPGEGNGDNTFLGDYRLRQQREACTLWPRGDVPKDYPEPVRSNVPIVMTTGQWDPVTPPLYAALVAKGFPNSLNIVVPGGGHGFGGLEGLDCLSKLTADFITMGSVKGLDTSCVAAIHRIGFQLKMADR